MNMYRVHFSSRTWSCECVYVINQYVYDMYSKHVQISQVEQQ